MRLDYPIQAVPFTQVHVKDGFWATRLDTNRTVTIPYCLRKCEEFGRISNFEIAAGVKTGQHRGQYTFDDTDVYKLIEAASYSLKVVPDPELERYLDDVIALIAAAQEPDGYLLTARRNKAVHLASRYGAERWSQLLQHSHELYNLGHLYEAAVAHHLATGKRTLLDVATKSADLVAATFKPGGNERPVCHQIIEMALVRLYRVTGREAYLQLAKFIFDARGKNGEAYTQDHLPVTEQHEAVGHAVRAMYMYAGMTDIAAIQGDELYRVAVDQLWSNVVGQHLYLTGGIGSQPAKESFGPPYELPNASGYCETCAAIGLAFWSHRLFLLHGDAAYLDVLERAIYNGVLSGIAMTGDRFFYPNPLESFGEHHRSEWFGCACCPGNVARFIPSVPGYAYASHASDVYVNLFLPGKATVATEAGPIDLVTATGYPWQGAVRLTVQPQADHEFTLRVRIPGWARQQPVPSDLYQYADTASANGPVTLAVNGQAIPLSLERGFAVVRRHWQRGDTVELRLPMPVRRVLSHDNVAENRGKVALERGPIVYCAEWPDQPEGRVLNLVVPDDTPLTAEWQPDLLGGLEVLSGTALATTCNRDGQWTATPQPFVAIPYYAWNHRGSGEMTVWLARSAEAARPLTPADRIGRSTIRCSSGAAPAASTHAWVTQFPDVRRHRLFHWRPSVPGPHWVECRFDERAKVEFVEVYWFDDTDNEDVPFPSAWRVLHEEDSAWKPVVPRGPYGVARHAFNTVCFEPVTTDALRLELELPPNVSGGIIEWRISGAGHAGS